METENILDTLKSINNLLLTTSLKYAGNKDISFFEKRIENYYLEMESFLKKPNKSQIKKITDYNRILETLFSDIIDNYIHYKFNDFKINILKPLNNHKEYDSYKFSVYSIADFKASLKFINKHDNNYFSNVNIKYIFDIYKELAPIIDLQSKLKVGLNNYYDLFLENKDNEVVDIYSNDTKKIKAALSTNNNENTLQKNMILHLINQEIIEKHNIQENLKKSFETYYLDLFKNVNKELDVFINKEFNIKNISNKDISLYLKTHNLDTVYENERVYSEKYGQYIHKQTVILKGVSIKDNFNEIFENEINMAVNSSIIDLKTKLLMKMKVFLYKDLNEDELELTAEKLNNNHLLDVTNINVFVKLKNINVDFNLETKLIHSISKLENFFTKIQTNYKNFNINGVYQGGVSEENVNEIINRLTLKTNQLDVKQDNKSKLILKM